MSHTKNHIIYAVSISPLDLIIGLWGLFNGKKDADISTNNLPDIVAHVEDNTIHKTTTLPISLNMWLHIKKGKLRRKQFNRSALLLKNTTSCTNSHKLIQRAGTTSPIAIGTDDIMDKHNASIAFNIGYHCCPVNFHNKTI